MHRDYIEISERRKIEHIENFLKVKWRNSSLFEDIVLENNSFPELDFSEIDTGSIFLNKKIDYPVMINAITGGFEGAFEINKDLAKLASKFNIPMAVGSQSLGLKNDKIQSYTVVREIMKDKVVIANVSANSNYDKVLRAVDMISADAVQLHLNTPQEMCMNEGDRDFRGIHDNIKYISNRLKVPVIVKQVGFGMRYSDVKSLVDSGIKFVDIGGKGGTNFIEIEDMRSCDVDYSDIYDWGIPTAASLLQCRKLSESIDIIASGGINSATDIVKSLTMNSAMTGVCGLVFRSYMEKGYEDTEKMMEEIFHKIKIIMMLLGCKTICELRNVNPLIKGELRQWMRD